MIVWWNMYILAWSMALFYCLPNSVMKLTFLNSWHPYLGNFFLYPLPCTGKEGGVFLKCWSFWFLIFFNIFFGWYVLLQLKPDRFWACEGCPHLRRIYRGARMLVGCLIMWKPDTQEFYPTFPKVKISPTLQVPLPTARCPLPCPCPKSKMERIAPHDTRSWCNPGTRLWLGVEPRFIVGSSPKKIALGCGRI